jgi:methylated-DNA-[protein]-cysteine S-methyltransferase
VDWQLSHGFRRRVLRELPRIPYGETLTYSEIAARAGNPRAQRAAGSACGSNPVPLVVPCHRVVRTGGQIGNYGGGPEMKEFLLELEDALPLKRD